jgi:TetR/AcrR family transcriptional repressor of bet genes
MPLKPGGSKLKADHTPAGPYLMSEAKAGINTAIQAERRRLLIDATMSAISEHGLSRLTLAKIARVAGLSAGSMNFHFASKEALLLETLNFLVSEFETNLDGALAAAGPDPAARLWAMFDASLDPKITEPRKMAVWYAFASEARDRAEYQRICGAQEKKIFDITLHLCDQLIRQGDRQDYMNARAMANAVQGLIDEIWHEILYAGDDYDRDDAHFLFLSFLASVFPWAFEAVEQPSKHAGQLSAIDRSLRIVRAGAEQLADAAQL